MTSTQPTAQAWTEKMYQRYATPTFPAFRCLTLTRCRLRDNCRRHSIRHLCFGANAITYRNENWTFAQARLSCAARGKLFSFVFHLVLIVPVHFDSFKFRIGRWDSSIYLSESYIFERILCDRSLMKSSISQSRTRPTTTSGVFSLPQ